MKFYCNVFQYFKFICLLGVLVTSPACSPVLPNLQQMAPLPEASTCRIAVLPFANDSEFLNGDLLVYRVFVSELLKSGNYILPLEGDIRRTFREIGLPYTRMMSMDQVRMLADRLDVDLVIGGQIIEMVDTLQGRPDVNPSLAVNFQIYDADVGELLWTTYHRREGLYYQKVMHFGTVSTITGLARNVSAEVLTLWYESGLKPCDH